MPNKIYDRVIYGGRPNWLAHREIVYMYTSDWFCEIGDAIIGPPNYLLALPV